MGSLVKGRVPRRVHRQWLTRDEVLSHDNSGAFSSKVFCRHTIFVTFIHGMAFSVDQNSNVLIADWLRECSKYVVRIGYRESVQLQQKMTIDALRLAQKRWCRDFKCFVSLQDNCGDEIEHMSIQGLPFDVNIWAWDLESEWKMTAATMIFAQERQRLHHSCTCAMN